MPIFSQRSKDNLATCDDRLQVICKEAIEIYDFTVLCGHRTEKEQNEAFKRGASKLKYPASKHNKTPSLAVDLAPYPIIWSELPRFFELAGIIKGIAHMHNIEIEWGGDWQSFKDYPHFQLKG